LQSIRIGYDQHRHADSDDYHQPTEQRFYEKVVLVLFEMPDFVTLSAYTLLAIVWMESFLQSRRHWLSARRYRRMWLIAYLVFNAVLYLGQVCLYTLLFLPNIAESWAARALYTVLTTVNFGLPIALLVLFFYLSCAFSGFPFKSEAAMRRHQRAGRILLIWTLGRVCWALFALTAALQLSLATSNASEKTEIYSVLVVVLYLVTELGPFAIALDDDVLALIGEDLPALQQNSSSSNMGGSSGSVLPSTGSFGGASTQYHEHTPLRGAAGGSRRGVEAVSFTPVPEHDQPAVAAATSAR
jgi:Protein of unknown function (DUF1084)